MVSFSCEQCADVLNKKKLDAHRCNAGFTCLDCNHTFYGASHKSHTQCVSEAERYEKSVYKKRKTDNTQGHIKAEEKKMEPAQEAKSEAVISLYDELFQNASEKPKKLKKLIKNLTEKDLKSMLISKKDNVLIIHKS